MKTNKDYQATFKAKQKASGLVQFHDWCYPEDKPIARQRLKELRDKHKREDDENITDSTVTDVRNRASGTNGCKVIEDDPDS